MLVVFALVHHDSTKIVYFKFYRNSFSTHFVVFVFENCIILCTALISTHCLFKKNFTLQLLAFLLSLLVHCADCDAACLIKMRSLSRLQKCVGAPNKYCYSHLCVVHFAICF